MYFLALCEKEECLTVYTLGLSYGYWVPREVKSLMQGCPSSDLCLVFAVQREGFQPVDREFQSGLLKAFLRLHPPPSVDVSNDSFAKVFAGLPALKLPNRMPF